MNSGPLEIYTPRITADRGIWDLGAAKFKVYDLLAEGMAVTDEMIVSTKTFLREEILGRVEDMGDNNGLGFVIIHPGSLGVTIAAHWWAQGSVLCQHIYRRQYDDTVPMDTINRPAVACVWELEIIAAEQKIWRETMMGTQHDADAYLKSPAIQMVA